MTSTAQYTPLPTAPIDSDFGMNLTAIEGVKDPGGVDILIHGIQASRRFVYDQREQKSLERDFLLLQVSTVSKPSEQAVYHTWSRTIIRRLLPATNGSTAVVPFPKPIKANLRDEATANGFSTLVLS